MSGRQEILENKSYTPGSPIESVHKYSILDVDNLLEKKDNNLLCRTSECIYL